MSTSFCSSSCASASSASGTEQLSLPGAALKEPWQHVLDVDVDFLDRRAGDDLEGREALLAHVDLDLLLIEPAVAQLLAQLLARALRLLANARRLLVVVGRGRQRRQQQIQDALLGGLTRLLAHLRDTLLANHVDGKLGQVPDHRFHVAADVADLRVFRRFNLDEGRLRQPRQPARDLGLADAGRSDHQDVLRRDLLGQLRRELLAPRAVAEGDGHGALGAGLTHHVLVELGDDLSRGQSFDARDGGFR